MQKLMIIVQDSPYALNTKAWDALRCIGALLAGDVIVRLCLLGPGAELGKKEHRPTDGYDSLEELLTELIDCGLTVSVCGKSMCDFGIKEEDLIEGVKKGSMKLLADWIAESNHVLAF